MNRENCIVFTGGGTGGHIYPGLAVIQSLRSAGFSGRIAWIGSSKQLDRDIVESEGVEYFAIPSGKLRRSLSFSNILDIFRVAAGYFASIRLLKKIRPDLLFSKGGYVSVPPCKAAAALRIPYITHESDTSPGLATRLNASKASRILTSWPTTAELFPSSLRGKITAVGNPVRPSLFLGDASRGRGIISAPAGVPIIFFFGGSQGSQRINDIVTAIRPRLAGRACIVHQTGSKLYDPAVFASVLGEYYAAPYFGEDMKDILAASDIIAGRAGAGTVWEAAALGKPMVLIPLSGSGTRGDQVENARMAEQVGAARFIQEGPGDAGSVLAALDFYLNDADGARMAGEAGMAMTHRRSGDGKTLGSAEIIARILLDKLEELHGTTRSGT